MFSAVVFAYSEVGQRCLQVLLEHGVRVPLVFTHEDQAGEQRWFGSVAELARSHGLRTVTPAHPAAPQWLQEIRSSARTTCWRSTIARCCRRRCWRCRAGGRSTCTARCCRRYRGRAPVNWAIANGETQTGATLHYMVARPDAGPIVAQEAVAIGPERSRPGGVHGGGGNGRARTDLGAARHGAGTAAAAAPWIWPPGHTSAAAHPRTAAFIRTGRDCGYTP